MAKYRYGFVFNLGRILQQYDPSAMLADVDRKRFLEEIVRFLTEGIENEIEGRDIISEVEHLVEIMHYQEVIEEYMVLQDEPYVKLCGIVFAICETILNLLVDVRFYKYLDGKRSPTPKVIPLRRGNYAVVVGYPQP